MPDGFACAAGRCVRGGPRSGPARRPDPTLQRFVVGIGEGNATSDLWSATPISATDVSRSKVCVVGEPMGTGLGLVTTNDSATIAEVPIYGAVRLLEPQPAPIRVIVDAEVFTTVPVQRR